MEGVDSPLEVLSLAATMIQDSCLPPSYEEARKELPSSRWRRERRSGPLLHPHPHPADCSASAREGTGQPDAPLDMSTRSRVSSRVAEREQRERVEKEKEKAEPRSQRVVSAAAARGTRVARGLGPVGGGPAGAGRGLPPSYSEAISSKSAYRLSASLPRPSVITCTPPSPTFCQESDTLIKSHSKETEKEILSDDGMCDPVIDEHFRRSLGKDYMTLFAKKTTSPLSNNNHKDGENRNRLAITGLSVDDHFAKALGDTWIKLQAESSAAAVSTKSTSKETAPTSIPSQRRGVVTI